MISEIEFKERLESLPPDFYFDNKEHFFYGCKGIIKNLKIINPNAVAPTLTNFCYLLFDFTIENLEKILELKLKYPTEVYSFRLRFSKDAELLLNALKSIESIMSDYKKMFSMTFEEIEKCDLKKYFEPKRFNLEQKTKSENEKKKNKLKSQVDTAFRWSGYHIDKEKLVNNLYDVIDVSGVYRIYNNNNELLYIGKSYNLASRIPSSMKERRGCAFDYAVINNRADTDIYEIYYICKFQPPLNEASNTGDTPTVVLPDIEFSKITNVYKEEPNDKILIDEYSDKHAKASITFKTQEELDAIIADIVSVYDIKSSSKIKVNEYCKTGTEYTINLNLVQKSEGDTENVN